MRLRLLLAVVTMAAIAACEPWDAPYQKNTRSVEGCDDAVAHLRSCCPRFDSYISCTYLNNATALPDVTASDSRCLLKKSCAELEHAVTANDRVCGFLPPSRRCR